MKPGAAQTAIFTVCIAVAGIWTEAKDWIGDLARLAWSAMSGPWIAGAVLLSVAAYVFAIIWTGREEAIKTADNPTVTLPQLLRYLGHNSAWAAERDEAADGDWVADAFSEIRNALSLGRLVGYGICQRDNDGRQHLAFTAIPKDFWKTAQFDADAYFKMTAQTVTEPIRQGFVVWTGVRFDLQAMLAVWPRRSLWRKIRGRSPANRTSAVAYWKEANAGLPKGHEDYYAG